MGTNASNTLNEDWIKTGTWDLWRMNTLITTIPDLLWFLNVTDAPLADQQAAVLKMTKMPSWIPAPQELKDAATAFLATGEIQKGDVNGHVFHGNQWVAGEGGSGISPEATKKLSEDVQNFTEWLTEEKAFASDPAENERRAAIFQRNFTHIVCNPSEYWKQYTIARDNRNTDPESAAILRMLGYAEKPTVVSEAKFAGTPGPCLFSGITSGSSGLGTKLSALYFGTPRFGGGNYGAAFYTSSTKDTAADYSRPDAGEPAGGCIFRSKLANPSNVLESQDIPNSFGAAGWDTMASKNRLFADAQMYGGEIYGGNEQQQYAYQKMAKAFDSFQIASSLPALAGYDAFHDNNRDYTMVLNRSAMVVPEHVSISPDGFGYNNVDETGALDPAKNVLVSSLAKDSEVAKTANALLVQALGSKLRSHDAITKTVRGMNVSAAEYDAWVARNGQW